jgi:hypothetical protein
VPADSESACPALAAEATSGQRSSLRPRGRSMAAFPATTRQRIRYEKGTAETFRDWFHMLEDYNIILRKLNVSLNINKITSRSSAYAANQYNNYVIFMKQSTNTSIFLWTPCKRSILFSVLCRIISVLNSLCQWSTLYECSSEVHFGSVLMKYSRWPRGTLHPQKLAITSPTSGGRSVGIVRSRTQTMEFV